MTDETGQPVKGLREQDFQLSENGKRQKLDAFEEHNAPAEPLAPPVSANLPTNTFTNAASSVPDSINVILLDQLNTSMKDQEIGLREVKDFISKKPVGAAFAIFVLRNDDPFCNSVPNISLSSHRWMLLPDVLLSANSCWCKESRKTNPACWSH